MSYIIDPGDLNDIRVDLGPQAEEGLGFIATSGGTIRQGAQKAPLPDVLTLVPCRAQIVPYHRTKEEAEAGVVGGHLRYLVELPAFTRITEQDRFLVAAPKWGPGQSISAGEFRIPTTPNGKVYRALTAGVTGGAEPDWGQPVSFDGKLQWQFGREYLSLDIVEIARSDPYEITRNIWGDLKS